MTRKRQLSASVRASFVIMLIMVMGGIASRTPVSAANPNARPHDLPLTDIIVPVTPINQLTDAPYPVVDGNQDDGKEDCVPASLAMVLATIDHFNSFLIGKTDVHFDYPTVRALVRTSDPDPRDPLNYTPVFTSTPILMNGLVYAAPSQPDLAAVTIDKWKKFVLEQLHQDTPILADIGNWSLLPNHHGAGVAGHSIVINGIQGGRVYYVDPWEKVVTSTSLATFDTAWRSGRYDAAVFEVTTEPFNVPNWWTTPAPPSTPVPQPTQPQPQPQPTQPQPQPQPTQPQPQPQPTQPQPQPQPTQPQPPAAPSLVSPENTTTLYSGSHVNFTWNAVPGATAYTVEYWGGPLGSPLANTVNGTSFSSGQLWDGNTYSWHVQASNSAGAGPWSPTWSFTISTQLPPGNSPGCQGAPTLLSPDDGATVQPNTTVTFTWQPPSNCTPDGYTLRINTSVDDPNAQPLILDTGVGSTSYSYTFNQAGTYYWHVTACKPCSPQTDYTPGAWATHQIVVQSNGGVTPTPIPSPTPLPIYAVHAPLILCVTFPCLSPATLYTLNLQPGGSDTQLGLIQTATGDTPRIYRIAVAPDGTLYGTDGQELYSINTGSPCCLATQIGQVDPNAPYLEGLAFAPDGQLFGTLLDGSFVTIDTTTGMRSAVPNSYSLATLGSPSGGMTFSSTGMLYVTNDRCSYQPGATCDMSYGDSLLEFATNLRDSLLDSTAHATSGFSYVSGLFWQGNALYGVTSGIPGTGASPCTTDTSSNSTSTLIALDPTTGVGQRVGCLSTTYDGVATQLLPSPPTPEPTITVQGALATQGTSGVSYGYGQYVLNIEGNSSPVVGYAIQSESVNLSVIAGFGCGVSVTGYLVPGYPQNGGPPLLDVTAVNWVACAF